MTDQPKRGKRTTGNALSSTERGRKFRERKKAAGYIQQWVAKDDDEKKKRGRPPTGTAMSNAERQRRYMARLKERANANDDKASIAMAAGLSIMKDTFSFGNHSIGIRVFANVPHFCARDIGNICGYVSGLPLREEDKPVRSGSYNYVSLHHLGQILNRATGERRQIAIDLLEAIQREFVAAIPAPSAPIPAAPVESDYDRKIKANMLEMELDELRSREAGQMMELHRMSKAVKGTRGKIYERERELATLRDQNDLRVIDFQRRLTHG